MPRTDELEKAVEDATIARYEAKALLEEAERALALARAELRAAYQNLKLAPIIVKEAEPPTAARAAHDTPPPSEPPKPPKPPKIGHLLETDDVLARLEQAYRSDNKFRGQHITAPGVARLYPEKVAYVSSTYGVSPGYAYNVVRARANSMLSRLLEQGKLTRPAHGRYLLADPPPPETHE